MNVLRVTPSALLAIFFMALSACSGGGGAPGTTTPGSTASLVADAGRDQSVFVGTFVTLNGSKSTNANQTGLAYAWALAKPAGSNAALSNPNIVNPTMTVDVEGTYTATLVVTDAQNPSLKSAPDTVLVVTSKTNPPPAANAGDDRSVFVGQVVTLNGSGSNDANNDRINFNWSFTTIPDRSSAELFDRTTVATSFVPDVPGTYTIQLVVNDGTSDSTPDSVTIISSDKPSPIARPGSDQFLPLTLDKPRQVTLDGSKSSTNPPTMPPDLDYAWSINSSTFPITLRDANKDKARFGIPSNVSGTVTAQLKVTDKGHPDPTRNTDVKTVNVIVGPLATIRVANSTCTISSVDRSCPSVKVKQPPSADLFIELDGRGSQGPSPQPQLTYEWTGASRSRGNPGLAEFRPDGIGNYPVTLKVGDGHNEDTVSVTLEVVTGPIINNPKVTIKDANNNDLIVNSVPPNTSAVVKFTLEGIEVPDVPRCTWAISKNGITITDKTITELSCNSGVDGATASIPGLSEEDKYKVTLNVTVAPFPEVFNDAPFAVNSKPTPQITQTRRANSQTSCLAMDLNGTTSPPSGFLGQGVTWQWSISPSASLEGLENAPHQKRFTVKGTSNYTVTLTVSENGAPLDSASNTGSVVVDLSRENAGHTLYHTGITGVTSGGCVGCHSAGGHDINNEYEQFGSKDLKGYDKDTILQKLQNGTTHTGRSGSGSASDEQAQQLAAFFATVGVGCLDRGSTAGH